MDVSQNLTSRAVSSCGCTYGGQLFVHRGPVMAKCGGDIPPQTQQRMGVTAYPPAGLGAMTRPERAQMTGCIVRQPLSNLREGSG